MKGLCALGSGSKGNSIYLGTENCKLLIDAGLSGKAICERLQSLNLSIEEIDAILVTHDHGDHIRGLKRLATKYQIPIFANTETAKGIVDYMGHCPQFKIFTTGETFSFADLEIHPFSIPHDTLDPVAFTIHYNKWKLGICTDLGYVTSIVKSQLRNCDFLYLEANHDLDLLHGSARPESLKRRISGKNGHLSNEEAGLLAKEISHQEQILFLAHLSEDCNSPKTAQHIVEKHLLEAGIELEIEVASQHSPTRSVLFKEKLFLN